MSYAAQQPVAAPPADSRPAAVTAAVALLWTMAVAGLVYAISMIAIAPGTISRFRDAAGGTDQVESFIAVIWIDAAVAVVVAVVVVALFTVLGVGLRRGSRIARGVTLGVCVLGFLAAVGSLLAIAGQRAGDALPGSVGEALGAAYPNGWIGLNVAVASAQAIAYIAVAGLLLMAPKRFFGGADQVAGHPHPAAGTPGSWPGPAAPGYGPHPGLPAPAYGPHPGLPAPGYGPQPTPSAPSYGPQSTPPAPGYGPQSAPPAPGYGPQSAPPAPSYGPPFGPPPPGYGPQSAPPVPGYEPPSGFAAPGYGPQSGHGPQPNFPMPGYGQQAPAYPPAAGSPAAWGPPQSPPPAPQNPPPAPQNPPPAPASGAGDNQHTWAATQSAAIPAPEQPTRSTEQTGEHERWSRPGD